MSEHDLIAPSPWVTRWGPLITHGEVLDVACGSGRHARWFAGRGVGVVAVDRVMRSIPGVRFVQADLETGHGWPFSAGRFACVVVTNYLHRPLFADLRASLAPDGVLIYETFMIGNERYGRPSNPAFLLQPGELLSAFADLRILAFEQGTAKAPKTAVIQRLCATVKQKV
jgi:SAM-dependent methyltransferase